MSSDQYPVLIIGKDKYQEKTNRIFLKLLESQDNISGNFVDEFNK
jgi:hypothetical protein